MMHISSPWRRFRTGALSLIMAGLVLPPAMRAQTRPPVGIRQNTPAVHAFTNARIVVAPGHTIAKGTLVIRDGVIEAVGENVTVPADARIWDLSGMTVYPGLIDSYFDIGMPKKAQPSGSRMFGGGGGTQQSAPEAQGVKHWNENVQAAQHAEEIFTPDDKSAEKMRAMGWAKEKGLRLIVVLDEAWKIAKDDNSDAVMIVREGRKYNFGIRCEKNAFTRRIQAGLEFQGGPAYGDPEDDAEP